MKYGIVSYGNSAYYRIDENTATSLISKKEDSSTLAIWQSKLQELGFDSDDHKLGPEHLFDLIKTSFEKRLNCNLDVSFDRKFIASFDGTHPVRHDSSSRIFSGIGIVYLDELMVSVLFEYVATYYIWARYDDDVFSFCFPYVLNTLNYCCRQGFLSSDKNRAKLAEVIKEYCDDVAVEFISDLYWSILAFAFCHELAHIYLGHVYNASKKTDEELRSEELSADALGYDIFLSIIDRCIDGLDSPFLLCFHDYLYTAPMILFLFYKDLYFLEFWLFGEEMSSNDHPFLKERIDCLIKLSENEEYQFNTTEGNIVLNTYWDISDKFCEELFYKLKNGKLSHMAQKGKLQMDDKFTYKEAVAFDSQMRNEVKDLAIKFEVGPDRAAGLYDIATRIEKYDENELYHFVWSKRDSVYSMKPYNVIFRQKAALLAILDVGLSLSIPDNPTETIMFLLQILLKLAKISTIEITEEQVKVLVECHNCNAYMVPIEENILLKLTSVSQKTIDELCRLKCIELIDGKVWLREDIWL